MDTINPHSYITANTVLDAATSSGTPVYLYDERLIIDKCESLLSMPNAFGLTVRYAIKANPNRSLLKIIGNQGLHFDASSLNEVRRAFIAGIDYDKIILTTQEVPKDAEKRELQDMMKQGLKYNVCSLRQLYSIGDFAAENGINPAIRVHPGVGSGESAARNTGDNYSCFGVHLSNLAEALEYAEQKGIVFDHLHAHIGSGADPEIWRSNIDLELSILEKHFPHAETINFGGGLKEARMPNETPADIRELGMYAKTKLEQFHEKTGRKLRMEIEPGTYVVANSGFAVTRVIDKKRTGANGLNFIVVDGGVELNARPLLYASRHPFYVIASDGRLLSSEFDGLNPDREYSAVIAGKCCETGDSQCLDNNGVNTPRAMAEPDVGDIVVIGGVGAYCSSMTPFNYNSHLQAPEALLTRDGTLKCIRRKQTLEQLVMNEA